MRGFHNSSFDPQALVLLETAFDEAWLTLKSIGNTTVKPDELARSVLRLAAEGERDPVRLHDGALEGLLPATTWREAELIANTIISTFKNAAAKPVSVFSWQRAIRDLVQLTAACRSKLRAQVTDLRLEPFDIFE
jgi:hypothetical protein